MLKRALITLAVLLTLAYGIDFSYLEYRVSKPTGAYGSVTIEPYYAVQLKNGKTEFMFDKPQAQTCVHSLFPHLGCQPCWYLSRQTKKRINI